MFYKFNLKMPLKNSMQFTYKKQNASLKINIWLSIKLLQNSYEEYKIIFSVTFVCSYIAQGKEK